jgi:hypothetical protein
MKQWSQDAVAADKQTKGNSAFWATDSPAEGTGFEPSVPARAHRDTVPNQRPSGVILKTSDRPPIAVHKGDRWFESSSLQRRVRLSRSLSQLPSRVENPAFRAAGLATGSAETRRVFQVSANQRQYLCRTLFQYRSAVDGLGENATPVPIKSGRLPSLIVRWIATLGPGSAKAQHDPLIVPGKRQA